MFSCSKCYQHDTDYVDEHGIYEKIYEFVCKGKLYEGILFLDSLEKGTDVYISSAYLQLYSSDSARLCSLLDSAYIDKSSRHVDNSLLFKRYLTTAKIYVSDNVHDYDKAMLYVKKAFEISPNVNIIGLSYDKYNIIGDVFYHMGNIVKSVQSYRTCLEKIKTENNTNAEIHAYIGLATVFHKWNRANAELDYANRAIQLVNSSKDIECYTIYEATNIASMAHEKNNNLDSALYYNKQAFQIAVLAGMTSPVESLKEKIIEIQRSATGDNQQVLPYNNIIERDKELRNKIKQHELELKAINANLENTLVFESFRNKILLIISLTLFVFFVIIIFYLRKNYQANKQKVIESESRLKDIEAMLDLQQINPFLAEQNAVQFMEKFSNKYPYFVSALQEKNQSITNHDILLCALISIGESNETIMEIRHISKESLWAARYRIRNKLKLNHDEKLEVYLSELLNK